MFSRIRRARLGRADRIVRRVRPGADVELGLGLGRPLQAWLTAHFNTKDPLSVSAYVGLAMAAMARRDFLEAEAGLRRAEKIEPGRPAIQLQLAQVYARSGRKREAQQAAGLAVRLGVSPAIAAAALGSEGPEPKTPAARSSH